MGTKEFCAEEMKGFMNGDPVVVTVTIRKVGNNVDVDVSTKATGSMTSTALLTAFCKTMNINPDDMMRYLIDRKLKRDLDKLVSALGGEA